ncbi:hypothetical protein DITRI_Ditri10aG0076100 [Diplodiscus trichospermus]
MKGSSVRTLEKIYVLCGENYGKNESYVKATNRLGEVLGKRGIYLIYGGEGLGLMGCVSTAAIVHGRWFRYTGGTFPNSFLGTVKDPSDGFFDGC